MSNAGKNQNTLSDANVARRAAAVHRFEDEAIQATQAVIDQTRRVKEGLLQDLLTDKVRVSA